MTIYPMKECIQQTKPYELSFLQKAKTKGIDYNLILSRSC
jgi:hypothetical protein